MTFQPGDLVHIRRDNNDEWCRAEVKLISPNGRSIGLMIHGMVREGAVCIAGALPLIYDPDTEQFSGLLGDLYHVELLHHHE